MFCNGNLMVTQQRYKEDVIKMFSYGSKLVIL